MSRDNPQGIPPHMLHLYVSEDQRTASSLEFKDDAVRIPALITAAARVVTAPIRFVMTWGASEEPVQDFRPDSAKAGLSNRESQYLGNHTPRDSRWTNSAK